MEWEVLFFCNSVGVLLLILIAAFHVIGKPQNPQRIN